MKVYNQIYKSIEAEVIDLAFSITLSEGQKNVYSPKIADLVLRAASLLESALKYSYSLDNEKDEKIKYDSNELMKVLKLVDSKDVYIHWNLYEINKRQFAPFVKNEERVDKDLVNVGVMGNQNYSWNNAYQSLRHKFVESIPYYGNLYYLFEALTALYSVLDIESKIFGVPLKHNGERTNFWSHGEHDAQVRGQMKN